MVGFGSNILLQTVSIGNAESVIVRLVGSIFILSNSSSIYELRDGWNELVGRVMDFRCSIIFWRQLVGYSSS